MVMVSSRHLSPSWLSSSSSHYITLHCIILHYIILCSFPSVGIMFCYDVSNACTLQDKDFYIMELDNGLYVDGKYKGSNSRFINHSCDPNCELQRWVVKGEWQ